MAEAVHPSAVSSETLQTLTGYNRAADIEKWCDRHGIRYFHGRNGPWTTLDALNAALGLRTDGQAPRQRLEF